MASSLGSFASSATRGGIRGFIDGLPHQSAVTCGDGACALHAVLGQPGAEDGVLHRFRAREEFLSDLPIDHATLCEGGAGILRGHVGEFLDSVWPELALPAARAAVPGDGAEPPSAEARIFWQAMRPEQQEQ